MTKIDLDNPSIAAWIDGTVECWCVSPEYKGELILDYARRFGLTTFVETGTWHGDTVEYVRKQFNQIYSIELGVALFEEAKQRFAGVENVHLFHGDSGEVLEDLLVRLPKTPTLFWLDAHPSGGDTVGAGTPLEKELTAIFESGFGSVILIDDLQDFWNNGWADLARRVVAKHPDWQQEIKFGIMRVTHR